MGKRRAPVEQFEKFVFRNIDITRLQDLRDAFYKETGLKIGEKTARQVAYKVRGKDTFKKAAQKARKQAKKESPSEQAFRAFVEKQDRSMSAREIKRRYRAQGGSIGDHAADAIIRAVFGRKKNYNKITKVKKYWIDQEGPNGLPFMRYEMKYNFIVSYRYKDISTGEWMTGYVTVSVGNRIQNKTVIQMAKDFYLEREKNVYKNEEWDLDSLRIEYYVYNPDGREEDRR